MPAHTRIYITTGSELAIVTESGGTWRAELALAGRPTECIAADPLEPSRVYCGTFGHGLWVSEDVGRSWLPVGTGIAHAEVMSVAVSSADRVAGRGVVWAGTEPSAIFRSEDGGRSWIERPALAELPSAPTWSFPPRPWTSHVRCIAPDPNERTHVYAGIELGGVMRSLDGGRTWEDRKPGSQHDSHVLRTHPTAPGRVYEVAGGGYAESHDGGATWTRFDAGLHHHYLWGLAIDSGDPETMVLSASRGPGQAHSQEYAESFVYRRSAGEPWRRVVSGLPNPRGTRAFPLAPHPALGGVFFGATHNGGLYRSSDGGENWERLVIAWPEGYQMAVQASPAIEVTSVD